MCKCRIFRFVLGFVHSARSIATESLKSLLPGVNNFMILRIFPVLLQAVQFAITLLIIPSVFFVPHPGLFQKSFQLTITCMTKSKIDISYPFFYQSPHYRFFCPRDLLFCGHSLFRVQFLSIQINSPYQMSNTRSG